MKLFKNNRDILTRSGSATFGKRFLATFVDFMLVFILAIPLFEFSFAFITSKNKTYVKDEEIILNEIAYYDDYVKPTHLAYFVKSDDGTETRSSGNDEMSLFFVKKLLYSSVTQKLSEWESNGFNSETIASHYDDLKTPATNVLNESNPTETYTLQEANYLTDDVAYFFTQYVPMHNENNDIVDFGSKTKEEYYDSFFKNSFGSYFDSYFYPTVVEGVTSYPILRTDIAIKLFKYLYLNDNSDDAKQTYSYIYQYYSSMQERAEQTFLLGKTYQAEHYTKYLDAYNDQAKKLGITLFICFAIAYLLIVLPFGFIHSDGVSIGKSLSGIAIIDCEAPRGALSPLKHILRGILNIPAYCLGILMFGFFPPFSGAFGYLVTPIFASGTMNLFFLCLIILGISLINIVPVLFTHYHQSLLDMIFKTKIVDLKKEIEDDVDTKDVGVN